MRNAELENFSHFYRQSCGFRRQKNHQATASHNERTDAKYWLKYFTGSNRPFWLNEQSVSNLVCAMRNYQYTIHRDGHDLAILCNLIGEFAVKLNAQEIANTLLALNQIGVSWDTLPRGLGEKLWAAVDRNAVKFNAQDIANSLLVLNQMGVSWVDIETRGLGKKLWVAVDRNAEEFNAQNIANTLLALNQMGVRWDTLPRGLGEKLWAAVDRNA